MYGKNLKFELIAVACLRPDSLKKARKEGVGREIIAYVW